jgi:hypothetical protein
MSSCSTISHFFLKNNPTENSELRIKASPSQNPNDELKIFGFIELENSSAIGLPYRAVNYHIQLLNESQNEILSEANTNRNGEFVFTVSKENLYFLKITSNQNKVLSKIHGPFKAADAITIKISLY